MAKKIVNKRATNKRKSNKRRLRKRRTNKRHIKGGFVDTPSYTNFDPNNNNHYALNQYLEDPNYVQVSTRNVPNFSLTGGNKKRKTQKKYKKGGEPPFSIQQQFNNPISTFPNANIFSNASSYFPETYNQPSSNYYPKLI